MPLGILDPCFGVFSIMGKVNNFERVGALEKVVRVEPGSVARMDLSNTVNQYSILYFTLDEMGGEWRPPLGSVVRGGLSPEIEREFRRTERRSHARVRAVDGSKSRSRTSAFFGYSIEILSPEPRVAAIGLPSSKWRREFIGRLSGSRHIAHFHSPPCISGCVSRSSSLDAMLVVVCRW